MPTLDEFLKEHSRKLADVPEAPATGVVLNSILLSVTDDEVVFGHFGVTFRARRANVIGVDIATPAIPNPFGTGIPCQLVLAPDSDVRRIVTYKASDLLQNLPYGIARPSQIPATPNMPSGREQDWLHRRGLITPNVTSSADSTYTRTDSSQNTATYSSSESSGVSDDTVVDDSASDSMPNDDANVDDISNLSARMNAADTTYTRTDSAQVTATYSSSQSDGVADDTQVDDTPSDSMPNDDANQDD